MEKIFFAIGLSFLSACSLAPKFGSQTDTCFLLYNLKTSQYEKVIGGARCEERYTPCSTFKVPLAVMSFDAGILRDENTSFLWDGVVRSKIPVWNQDHTAMSWMQNSVVWYSQELTKMMGKKKAQDYLKKFQYGNEDFSGSLTQAWLLPIDLSQSTIKISAYEQIEFMKKLWTGTLPAKKKALDITKKITYLETSKNGFTLHGKTGSGSLGAQRNLRLGWFIAHIEGQGKEYLAVYTFNDKTPSKDLSYGGPLAKEEMKKILIKEKLW